MAKLDTYPVGVPQSGDLFPISRGGKTFSIDFDNLTPGIQIIPKTQFYTVSLSTPGLIDLIIPVDFSSLISIKLIGLGKSNTIAPSANINNNYAKIGEIDGSTTETNPALLYPQINNNNSYKIDISSVFLGVSATDICHFQWTDITGVFSVESIELRYTT